MISNRTFAMIKPDITTSNRIGALLNKIEENGFKVVAMKKIKLSKEDAEGFYAEHHGKEFFERLIKFITSGQIIPLILEKENAIKDFRNLMGSTNPEQAEKNTLRKDFATSLTINSIHGSDSEESAERERLFFFSKLEQL